MATDDEVQAAEVCDARVRGSGRYQVTVPYRDNPPAPYKDNVRFKEGYAVIKAYRPLRSGERAALNEIPWGFNIDFTQPWRGRSWFTQPNSSTEPTKNTIGIPGITDIIRTPLTDTPDIRRARLQRMRAAQSAAPEWVKGATRALTMLDNAQDMLYTALAVARALFPRILARIIPILGWALLVNDGLNLST